VGRPGLPRTVPAVRDLVSSAGFVALLAAPVPAVVPGGLVPALLHLAVGCGLRRMEIAGLEVRDVDVQGRRVRVRCGKGGVQAWLPLPEVAVGSQVGWLRVRRAAAGEAAYLVNRRGRRWELRSLDRLFGELVRAAGVPGRPTIHALRHLAITGWAEVGNLRDAQELARHASMSTTAGYVHPSEGRLRAVADRAAAEVAGGGVR